MKFLKIGNSMGSMVTSTAPKDITSNYMHLITNCEGEKVKWDDPIEKDAINLIVIWEVSLKHNDASKVWYIELKQHYGIKDKEVPPTNDDIINLIKESYLNFRDYLEKEGEDTDIILGPLDSALIHKILPKLLEVCNSEIQS